MERTSKIEILSVNETSEVYGGVIQFFITYAASEVLSYAFERYAEYWEDQVNNGWGEDIGTPPPHSLY